MQQSNSFLHNNTTYLLFNAVPFIQHAKWLCQHSKHFMTCVLWNSANVPCGFFSVMVISLILLPFNDILRFWKRMKSLGTKSGELTSCAMAAILFLARNSCKDKALRAGVGHEFGGKLTHVHTPFKNVMNWANWTFWNVTNLMHSDTSVLQDRFLHTVHIFICFSCWPTSWLFSIIEFIQIFNLQINSKTCVFFPLPAYLMPLSTFWKFL